MQLTALLPMKGHSSRVPNKNFRPIAGRPLFEWILNTLIAAPFIDQVIINTDAADELRVSNLLTHAKVWLRDRPAELCGDEVSMNLIINDDLHSCDCEHFLMTHTTNPLISVATLETAATQYFAGCEANFDSLFSVNEFRSRFYTEDGEPLNHDPNNLIPTQDLTPWYEENSCYYFFSTQSFRKTGARIGRRPQMHVTPKLESCDIDEWDDWHLAERLLQGDKHS
ncbi:MAG: acylneuraminate cytidylyltransferase family protein [Pseudomonadota bacterium]